MTRLLSAAALYLGWRAYTLGKRCRVPVGAPKKAYGTSRRIGNAADVEVPIVKTGKPEVTVVARRCRVPVEEPR